MIGLSRFRITIPKKAQEDVDKIIELLNNVFTNKDEERHIDDNRFMLSRGESGNRIIIVLIIFCAILIGFTQLIMGLIMLKAEHGAYGQYVYDQGDMHVTPINMNLNLIYYLGADSFLVDMGMTKNDSFEINRIRRLPSDTCGIFGMYDGTASINVFLGSEGKKTRTFDVNNWEVRMIKNDMTPHPFNNDATIVKFSNYIWIIGDNMNCDSSPGVSKLCSSGNYRCCLNTNLGTYSYVWSMSKKRWRTGPSIKPIKDWGLSFVNTCAISLNKTAILFIGLVRNSEAEQYNYKDADDTATAIYNFEWDLWELQDSLSYGDVSENEFIFDFVQFTQEHSCAMSQDKTENRIIAMSYLLKMYHGYEGTYVPYVWISQSKMIKWVSLSLENQPNGVSVIGSVVFIKGMLFYFLEYPHTHLQFCYQLKIINEKKVEFKQYSTNGWEKCKEFSKDEDCLKVSTVCKNMHSNEKVLPITYYKFH